ncbi:hypothetical protein ACFQ3N_15275 [Virgibacillus byunsanensis]|uniref:Lipoprotein n=1 Tax=Virgibacillus byunsanensis TaxID=570945 RepID=A0ABW3LPN7_9BACI
MYKRKILLIIPLSLTMFLLSGCFDDGISIPFGEDGESISVGGNEEEGFTFSAENNDGEEFSIDQSMELPEDFPSYIPFPDDHQLISSTTYKENEGEGTTVVYSMEKSDLQGVEELYINFMDENGYESQSEMKSEEIFSLTMKNAEEAITIYALVEAENETVVTLSVLKIQE